MDILKLFDPKRIFKWSFQVFEIYLLPRKYFRDLFNNPDEEKIAQTGFYVFISCVIITVITLQVTDVKLAWTFWIMFKSSLIHIISLFIIFIVVYAGNRGSSRTNLLNIILFVFTTLSVFEPFRMYFYGELLLTENYNMYLISNISITIEAIFIVILSCFVFYDGIKVVMLKLFLLWLFENVSGAVLNSVTSSTGDTAYLPSGPEPIYDEYINILNKMQTRHTILVPYRFNNEECYGINKNGELMQHPSEYKEYYDKVSNDFAWLQFAIDSSRYFRNKKSLLKHLALCDSTVKYFASGLIFVRTNDSNETYFTTKEKALDLFPDLYNAAFEEELTYHNIVARATYPLLFFNYYYYIRRKLNGERAWLVPPDRSLNSAEKMPEDMDLYR